MTAALDWTEDYRAGRVGANSVTTIAERAAVHLVTRREPMAVCLSRGQRVTVEVAAEALPEDGIIGVYCPSLGLIEVYRRIRDDLRAEMAARKSAA